MSDNEKEEGVKPEDGVKPETAVTFENQAAVDTMVQKRLGRAGEAATSTLLESLGVDSIDAVKAAMLKATELEQAQMSDAEKSTARVKELEDALVTANTATAAAIASKELQRKQTAVYTAATLVGFNDPADAHLFLDLAALEDDDSVKVAIVKLAEDRPYLVKAEKQTSYGSPIPKRKGVKENQNGRVKPAMKSPVRF